MPDENAITTVNFHGTEILVVAGDTPATTYIPMKPFAEHMGISWVGQLERLKQNQILAEGIKNVCIPTAGGPQMMVCLPLSLINGWLIGIQPTRIKDHSRRMMVFAYQREAFDVLFRHFFGKATQTPTHDLSAFDARLTALEGIVQRLAEGFAELARRSNERIEAPRSIAAHRRSNRDFKTMRSILLSRNILPTVKHDSIYKRCSEACAAWCDASDDRRDAYDTHDGNNAKTFDEKTAVRWYREIGRKLVASHRREVKNQTVMKFPKPKVVVDPIVT